MELNSNTKSLIYVAVSLAVVLPFIYLVNDYLYFYTPLSEISLDVYKKCDAACADNHQRRPHEKCAKVGPEDFVCRYERGHKYDAYSATPADYGEIVTLSEGRTLHFNMASMKITDRESERIAVEFNNFHGGVKYLNNTLRTVHSDELVPNDTFVAACTEILSENDAALSRFLHLVKYMGLYELDGTTYAEFWGVHIDVPDKLFPCDMERIIPRSLDIDYDLSLPTYDEFGFVME